MLVGCYGSRHAAFQSMDMAKSGFSFHQGSWIIAATNRFPATNCDRKLWPILHVPFGTENRDVVGVVGLLSLRLGELGQVGLVMELSLAAALRRFRVKGILGAC